MAQLRFFLLFTFLIAIIGFQSIYSQTVIESWTPEAMVNQPVVGSPATSPDGSTIAYTIRESKMAGEESEFLSHIWVATADGTMNRPSPRGIQFASRPLSSPDGQFLSFTSL